MTSTTPNNTQEAFSDFADSTDAPFADLDALLMSQDRPAAKSVRKRKQRQDPFTIFMGRVILVITAALIIGGIYGAFSIHDTLSADPKIILTEAFEQRGGVDEIIVGELLLTPDQRIENLGEVRQRSSTINRNRQSTEGFLQAIKENNPPDIYRSLISAEADESLLEQTEIGSLPTIGEDGRLPLLTYARPFNEKVTTPKISLIVRNLGVSTSLTKSAILLRPEVSLAFSPYTENLQSFVTKARKAGHEVLLELPMQAGQPDYKDAGPYALSKNYSTEKNIAQLEWILSRAHSYVGLINYQGDQLLKDEIFVRNILGQVVDRGLMFVESGFQGSVAREYLEQKQRAVTKVDLQIGFEDDEATITEKLRRALDIANRDRSVIIEVEPFPLILMRIALWLNELPGNKYHIVPISAGAQITEVQRLGLG